MPLKQRAVLADVKMLYIIDKNHEMRIAHRHERAYKLSAAHGQLPFGILSAVYAKLLGLLQRRLAHIYGDRLHLAGGVAVKLQHLHAR